MTEANKIQRPSERRGRVGTQPGAVMTFDELFAEHNLTPAERKALVMHLATLRALKTAAAMTGDQPVPLLAQQVIGAIRAVGDEAAKRGEMYPQTGDEQREDKLAVRRVVGMIEWYEKNTGCARLKGWPGA